MVPYIADIFQRVQPCMFQDLCPNCEINFDLVWYQSSQLELSLKSHTALCCLGSEPMQLELPLE